MRQKHEPTNQKAGAPASAVFLHAPYVCLQKRGVKTADHTGRFLRGIRNRTVSQRGRSGYPDPALQSCTSGKLRDNNGGSHIWKLFPKRGDGQHARNRGIPRKTAYFRL